MVKEFTKTPWIKFYENVIYFQGNNGLDGSPGEQGNQGPPGPPGLQGGPGARGEPVSFCF